MYTALIVDDEKPIRIAISKLLDTQRFGIDRLLEASNGVEALPIVKELHPDLVFLDIRMPEMDGLSFLRKAMPLHKGAGYFIISGYDDFAYAQQAIRLGASDYLLKPLKADELNSAVERALLRLHPGKPLAAAANPSTISADEAAEQIHRIIDDRYSEDLSVTSLTDQYYFSKEHISRLFKQKYNCSIYEYLLATRMKRAAQLMTDPAIRIQEIAARTGYSDHNYFSKAFRNYYGCTPSQYRERGIE